ncbi:PREDICTED: zinc finger protein ZAT1 [Tarenaya hassleriana]|uniref:zinc finger protein ZAT1 n=1 Tax=Tarenaya hassleriana TaxID=28532 RepID=UPI00053C101B|nr:PREDICTED: zinc finger protein ZAT1 [Tarenaya hassleriana]
MDKRKRKLCWKRFADGRRTLGGHMVKIPIPLVKHPESASSHSSSSSDDEEDKTISAADPEFSSSVSEAESFKNPTRKGSRLTRKPGCISSRRPQLKPTKQEEQVSVKDTKRRTSQITESWTEQEPASSVSDEDAATTEEDVAFCLMMLSRDKTQVENDQEHESENKKRKKRDNNKCETCGRIFKSYQALGGHVASHKKKKKNRTASEPVQEQEQETQTRKRIHECGICKRAFASGQALGGHMRSHSINSLRRESSTDLINLPAPLSLSLSQNFSSHTLK